MSLGASARVPPELSSAAARLEAFGGERAAVLARMVHAVVDLATNVDAETLQEAAGMDSNDAVLFQVLRKAPPPKADPLAAAKVRGVEARRRLMEAEGGGVSAEELGEMLGISRQAVDKRRRAGKLLAVEVQGRGLRYPVWQIHDGELLYGLEEVLRVLAADSPVVHIQFFLSACPGLDGRRPIELLRRRKRLSDVLAAAQTYNTHGAP